MDVWEEWADRWNKMHEDVRDAGVVSSCPAPEAEPPKRPRTEAERVQDAFRVPTQSDGTRDHVRFNTYPVPMTCYFCGPTCGGVARHPDFNIVCSDCALRHLAPE